jgi:hypothetical protein
MHNKFFKDLQKLNREDEMRSKFLIRGVKQILEEKKEESLLKMSYLIFVYRMAFSFFCYMNLCEIFQIIFAECFQVFEGRKCRVTLPKDTKLKAIDPDINVMVYNRGITSGRRITG